MQPQSNQRGIETIGKVGHNFLPRNLPQSNQRGIETPVRNRPDRREAEGLNRTSVGLKPFDCVIDAVGFMAGLNRTSVGLKPVVQQIFRIAIPAASIEPAWD